jgi:hypothetical protein
MDRWNDTPPALFGLLFQATVGAIHHHCHLAMAVSSAATTKAAYQVERAVSSIYRRQTNVTMEYHH